MVLRHLDLISFGFNKFHIKMPQCHLDLIKSFSNITLLSFGPNMTNNGKMPLFHVTLIVSI